MPASTSGIQAVEEIILHRRAPAVLAGRFERSSFAGRSGAH